MAETRAELTKEGEEYHMWEEKACAMNVGEKNGRKQRYRGGEFNWWTCQELYIFGEENVESARYMLGIP